MNTTVQEIKPDPNLRSASPDLRIRPVANGYLVDATVNRNMGYGSDDAQTYVFSGRNAESELAGFVEEHFRKGLRARSDKAAAGEPTLPPGLPPLPPVPEGFSRWEYRGPAWKPDYILRPWAWASVGFHESWLVEKSGPPIGHPQCHYIEAV